MNGINNPKSEMKWKTLCLAALLSSLALPSGAAVLYGQPPATSGARYKSAWYPPDGLDGDSYAYDSFQLSANQAITEIDWRGAYNNYLSGAGQSRMALR